MVLNGGNIMNDREKFIPINVTITKEMLNKVDELDKKMMIQNRSATVRMIFTEYFKLQDNMQTLTDLVKLALDEKEKEGKR